MSGSFSQLKGGHGDQTWESTCTLGVARRAGCPELSAETIPNLQTPLEWHFSAPEGPQAPSEESVLNLVCCTPEGPGISWTQQRAVVLLPLQVCCWEGRPLWQSGGLCSRQAHKIRRTLTAASVPSLTPGRWSDASSERVKFNGTLCCLSTIKSSFKGVFLTVGRKRCHWGKKNHPTGKLRGKGPPCCHDAKQIWVQPVYPSNTILPKLGNECGLECRNTFCPLLFFLSLMSETKIETGTCLSVTTLLSFRSHHIYDIFMRIYKVAQGMKVMLL